MAKPKRTFIGKLHDVHSRATSLAGRRVTRAKYPPEYAVLHEAEVQSLGRVHLAHPLEAAANGEEKFETSVDWPDAMFFRLKNTFVVGREGYIYFEDGSLLSSCPSIAKSGDEIIRRPIRRLAKNSPGTFFHLTGRNYENHGHFLFQHLLRLIAGEPHMAGNDWKILVAPGQSKWQGRYLEMLGYAADRIVECSQGTMICGELGYVPMLSGHTPLGDPALFRKLAARFHQHIFSKIITAPPPEKSPRVLFVSRADAPERKLLNEDELIAISEKLLGPTEKYFLRGKPLDQQIRDFNSADFIIGETGMGISDIVFARGKTLIILESGKRLKYPEWGQCYANIALLAGNQAAILYSGRPPLANSDWIFPPEIFRQKLGCLLAASERL